MDIKETYKEEANELLSELENSLLELESNPKDLDLIGRVFRAMHTIKGSGAMVGFENIASFTHDIETVFDLVRNEVIPVTKELIDLTLYSCDIIKKMVRNDPVYDEDTEAIVQRYKKLMPAEKKTSDENVIDSPIKKTEDVNTEEITYRIRLRPVGNIFKNGTNLILILNEIRTLGECSLVAQTGKIPDLEQMEPEICYIWWDIILTTVKDENTIRDIFIFIEDDSEIDIRVIDDGITSIDNEKTKKIGEILIDREDVSPDEITAALHEQKRIGEILVNKGKIDQDKLRSALKEQEHLEQQKKKQKNDDIAGSSIRVSSGKLDTLVDLVGELVTVQARLSQHSLYVNNSDLVSIAEEVERLTGELRDNTMDIRMLPIGTTFNKFKRLVRDLSNQLGKEVILTTEGAETELDKTVIESLNDPMVHIIRNCIDHGIELPDVRAASGKSRQGEVHLSAIHSGGNVLIKISDDGAGLDTQTIHSKAVEKGLVSSDVELDDTDIYSLIFKPGFSTAEKVTNVSGRGVGMDVVKRSVENLRGSIEVESKKSMGTTITLKLPLTLAIIDGLLVNIGKDHYVIPLSVVEKCVEMTDEDATAKHGHHIIKVRDELVPYVSLRELFGINGNKPFIEHIVITELDGYRIGFSVDHIIGEYQTVIKTLSGFYKNAQGFSGATILANGTVALILDVNVLSEVAKKAEQQDFK
jgi:two-component system, chemotaxis family, sensor kinase CheA